MKLTVATGKFTFLFMSFFFSLSVFSQSGSIQLIPPSGSVTSFASITAAYAAIPTPVVGNFVIEIQNNYNGTDASEVYPIQLTDRGNSTAGYSITIRPAAGNTTAVIKRPVASAGAVIQINGGDNITIDGRPGGITSSAASYLTISDNLAGNNASRNIELINGANDNIIQYINSISALPTANNGSRNIAISGGTAPNNNNIIQNSVISGGQRGIQDFGASATVYNSGTIIRNNIVKDFGNLGIFGSTFQTNLTIENNTLLFENYKNHLSSGLNVILNQSQIAGYTNIVDNTISFDLTSTSLTYIEIISANANGAGTQNILRNKIINITAPGSVTNFNCISVFLSGTININENSIGNILGGAADLYGITGGGTSTYTPNISVSRNKIYNLKTSASKDVCGIALSSDAGGVLNINNNFVSITDPNATASHIYGMEFPANTTGTAGNYTANIYYNTIRIGGTHTGGTAGAIASAAIYRQDNNAGSVFNFKNNIAVNDRSGGAPGIIHPAFYVENAGGSISLDYNTYYGTNSSQAVRWLNTNYSNSDLTAYKSAVNPSEQHSNFANVNFVSNSDLHLAGSSLSNTSLFGTPITGINNDIDGNVRSSSSPVQGAHEGVTVSPTTTSIASSLNPSVFGDNVTFTATVTASSGTPTGTLSFYDGTTLLGTGTLSGTTASFATSSLSIGSHSITAKFEGTGNFATSTSTAIAQVVNAPSSSATTTTLTSSLNPSTFGQAVNLTATVATASGTPTGTVSFYDGVALLGTVTISGSSAVYPSSALAVGSHSITAKYGGNSFYAVSTSGALTQVVNPAPPITTSTAVASSVNPSVFGQSITFTAAVTPVSGIPTGTVSFYDGTTLLGTGSISGNAATYTITVLSIGSHSITAKYDGNNSYATSTSPGLTQVINAAPVTTIPTIVSFTPQSGPAGTTVVISGSNFSTVTGNNVVYFGGVKANVTSANSQSLTVTVPFGATYQPITVTDVSTNLSGSSARPFLVTFTSNGVIGANSFASQVDFVTAAGPIDCFLGDIDNDGLLDLAVADANNFSLLRNTSSLPFISFAPRQGYPTGYTSQKVVLGDLDGDGKLDVVSSGVAPDSMYIYKNNSVAGNLSIELKLKYATGLDPQYISIADLNADGKPDIVVANYNSNTLSIFKNTSVNGNISFVYLSDISTGALLPRSIAIGDIDGDGKPDLSVACYNSTTEALSVFRNTSANGTISFASKVDFPSPQGPWNVAIADLDGDGKLDIAICGYVSDKASILRNTSSIGSVSFAAIADFTTGRLPESIAIDDINGDGKPDIVTGNYGDNTISILKNNCSPGVIAFGPKVDYATETNPKYIAIGDLDKDGKPDICVANLNSQTISVFKNQMALPGPSSTTTTLTSSLNPSKFAQGVTFTATVAAASGTPTGTVTFYDGLTFLRTVALSGNTATLIISTLSIGSHTIAAIYDGVTGFTTSLSPDLIQVVNAQSPTTTTIASSLNPSVYGQSVTFTATVSSSAGTPTGTVSFFDATIFLGSGTLSGNTATFTTTSLITGTRNIIAVYNGENGFASSTSATLPQVVNDAPPAPTTTTLISSVNPSIPGQQVVFTASVSPTVTGTVSLFDGTTLLGTATLGTPTFSGISVTFNVSSLTVGSHNITTVYNGTGSNAASTSNILIQVVSTLPPAATTTTITSSVNPSSFGQSIFFIATVAAPSGTPGGTISFYDGTTLLSTETLINGIVSYLTGLLSTGSHSITARYSGSSSYAASTSLVLIQGVNTAATTTTLNSSHNPSTAGQNVTFTAQLTSSSGIPTGPISFYDGTLLLGSVTPSGSIATYTTSALAAGSHSITAKYVGDVNYAVSTSNVVTQVVNAQQIAVITYSGNTTFCEGGSLLLNANTGTGLTYQWYKNNVVINGATTPVYTASTSGNYAVIITNSNSVSTTSNTVTIVVVPLPAAPAIIAASATTFCQGGSVILTSSATNGNQWYKDGNPITGSTANSLPVNSAGNYTSVVSANGCSSPASNAVSVTVNAVPTQPGTIAGSNLVCGGSTQTYAVPAVTGATGYTWALPSGWSGTSTTNSITTNAGSTGGIISVTATNSCGSSAPRTLNVAINQTPTITLQGDTMLISSVAPNYQWYNNNTALAGEMMQTLRIRTIGFYRVETSPDKTCWSASLDFPILVQPPGQLADKADMDIYPNPASGFFNVVVRLPRITTGTAFVTVSNASGNVILQTNKLVFYGNEIRIPVTLNATGTFFVKVNINGDVKTMTVILQ